MDVRIGGAKLDRQEGSTSNASPMYMCITASISHFVLYGQADSHYLASAGLGEVQGRSLLVVAGATW